jgi:mercuric ion transport protein
MKKQTAKPSRKGIYASVTGTILVAACCFTPVLVVVLGAIGLGTIIPYLDFVLLPGLLAMIVLTVISYKRWKRARVIERE